MVINVESLLMNYNHLKQQNKFWRFADRASQYIYLGIQPTGIITPIGVMIPEAV